MSIVSPLFDASVAGSLASASLCEKPPKSASAPRDVSPLNADRARPCAYVACKTKWRRLIDVLLSPISGPRFTH